MALWSIWYLLVMDLTVGQHPRVCLASSIIVDWISHQRTVLSAFWVMSRKTVMKEMERRRSVVLFLPRGNLKRRWQSYFNLSWVRDCNEVHFIDWLYSLTLCLRAVENYIFLYLCLACPSGQAQEWPFLLLNEDSLRSSWFGFQNVCWLETLILYGCMCYPLVYYKQ